MWLSGIGLLVGVAAFVVADGLLDRYLEGIGSGVSGFTILAAVTLDGVPEYMALGVSLLQTSWTGALALLVAIFASNLPEALGRAVSMRDQGRTRGFAIVVWTATAVILAAALVVGNVALSGASEKSLSVLLSFAGSAVLASFADTLMPVAYREGGKSVAFDGGGLLRLVRDLGAINLGILIRRPVVLRASAEVSGEETLGGGVELQAVLGTSEAVALILEEQVLVVYALLLHSGHDLLGLGLLDARVVRPLRDQHRCPDPLNER